MKNITNHSKRQKILIVDDEPTNLMVLNEALKADYQVFAVDNGRDALASAVRIKPDLVLLDIVMPDMDGYEICRAMKDNPLLVDIPLIFVSGKASDDDESVGLELGAVDYLTKPLNLSIVRRRVAIHLELKRQRDLLSRLALLDGLTGIPNRRAFDNCLNEEWRRAVRNGSRLSLIMIDIDWFKLYNDSYGHLAGDICLRRVARTLTTTFTRAGDFVARYGGEEFACVLPGIDERGLASETSALRFRVEQLAIPHKESKTSRFVTISIGAICCIPSRGTTPETLIHLADQNLYHAKDQGRNQVSMDTVNLDRDSIQMLKGLAKGAR